MIGMGNVEMIPLPQTNKSKEMYLSILYTYVKGMVIRLPQYNFHFQFAFSSFFHFQK